ncbi:MAG: APH(3')-II family aminoglycoside O-phosphotransferase [Pseudomonadota bacterium]
MTGTSADNPAPWLPPEWRADLKAYSWQRQTIGRSGALVFRLESEGRPALFVKSEAVDDLAELPGEGLRLRWLAQHAVPAPRLQSQVTSQGRHWLLASALPGRDLASSPGLAPRRVVALAADALRDLHRLPADACPFDHRLDRRIADARARVDAGAVDEADFDEERRGRDAADLLAELIARRPQAEDLVVAHGDACLPNLMAQAGRFAGFVDCGRLGVADRHQDLALACWSVRHNLGEAWVAPFLRHYGVPADPERLAYYRLLDEFF